ncbi:MAG: bifunctional methylenetetrahydrofolate dehydrogenase/methenyltetrahydrofolate cyclohydrolase FolD [Bacteroidetes bacterium]|nr:bifunctional methylenetetrahydrofolate dehydrogenase/methenyltetrahydrofolate cyclohydrolase FolD [Bacteroidota bacterium]
MAASYIDGKVVASQIKARVKTDIEHWVSKDNRLPSLQVILVGNNPASQSYVKSKTTDCEEVGIDSDTLFLPDTISEKELCEIIHTFNEDENTDGILVQLPVPDHISTHAIIEAIDYRKDVDGFHPMNVGRMQVGQPAFRPCTPAGIMELFDHYSIPTKGKHIVVIGASQIVGTPMAIMLSREKDGGKATVTLCHRYTKDLTKHTINADILVVAVGSPGLITGTMVKEDVVVIDVGINRVADNTNDRGYKIVGDCDFESVSEKASWITPVPGGVGPMTRALLMKNTLLAAKKALYP